MPLDAWLPVGFTLSNGKQVAHVLHEGIDWQLYRTRKRAGNVLFAKERIATRWMDAGLLDPGSLLNVPLGDERLYAVCSDEHYVLCPVYECKSPSSKSEALAFVNAIKETRIRDSQSSLHDAIYVEQLSRLLPTYSLSAATADDVVLGTWLAGGVPVSVGSFRRLHTLTAWLPAPQLQDIIQRAGLVTIASQDNERSRDDSPRGADSPTHSPFRLPGRPDLERFLIEHVIDIVENAERYSALGINFPSAVVLHGPPGCGKTFAVERLVEYLDWPSFEIDASSVASPYIHETSKKVADVFDRAIKNSPSVLVIDEMEAFLADRQMGSGSSHHRVEEVAEFLRRIPEAIKNKVLVIAMTNRLEMIDPAILRRGRFDHVVKVDMASEGEVASLLEKLISQLPTDGEIDVTALAKRLQGRPLSDVAFVVREGARLAARAGKDRLEHGNLESALESTPARQVGDEASKKIGFV